MNDVEELLMKLVKGQEEIHRRLDGMQQDIQGMKQEMCEMRQDIRELQEDMQGMKRDIRVMQQDIQQLQQDMQHAKQDVQFIKETVQRIEVHQEEMVMGMLTHIKKRVDVKENQIQVLNKRLFDVETKTARIEQ
jgi:chromosome segregation ATPase